MTNAFVWKRNWNVCLCMYVICWCIVCAQHNVNSGNCFICFVWFFHPLVQMAFGCIYTNACVLFALSFQWLRYTHTRICCTNIQHECRQWPAKLNATHSNFRRIEYCIHSERLSVYLWSVDVDLILISFVLSCWPKTMANCVWLSNRWMQLDGALKWCSLRIHAVVMPDVSINSIKPHTPQSYSCCN